MNIHVVVNNFVAPLGMQRKLQQSSPYGRTSAHNGLVWVPEKKRRCCRTHVYVATKPGKKQLLLVFSQQVFARNRSAHTEHSPGKVPITFDSIEATAGSRYALFWKNMFPSSGCMKSFAHK